MRAPPPLQTTLRALALALVALAAGACGTPRAIPLDDRPADRIVVPTSSVHYRAYADADALAAALRWSPAARPLVSAHRGGPGPGLPENALPTFEHALNFAPALLEVDVRPAAGGALMLLHDETLDRTTTGTGPLDAKTLAQVRQLRLVDPTGAVTSFRVPTLAEALAWAEGRAVLLLDVKAGSPYEAIVGAVRAARAEGRVIVITYSLEDHLRLARLAPDLNVSVMAETLADVEALRQSGADLSRVIAFAGVGTPDAAVVAALHADGIRVQAGTFLMDAGATPETYAPLLRLGVDVLSTDNVPAATIAVQRATRRG